MAKSVVIYMQITHGDKLRKKCNPESVDQVVLLYISTSKLYCVKFYSEHPNMFIFIIRHIIDPDRYFFPDNLLLASIILTC